MDIALIRFQWNDPKGKLTFILNVTNFAPYPKAIFMYDDNSEVLEFFLNFTCHRANRFEN